MEQHPVLVTTWTGLEHEASCTPATSEALTSDTLGLRLADADWRFDPDMGS